MLKPKKSLGQNFLRDEAVLKKIIASADLTRDDNVLEIGPGTGTLTKELLQKAGKVIAIEKDDDLAGNLKVKWDFLVKEKNKNSRIRIICGDILEINLPKLMEENNFQNYKVIANIPYYITSPIIRLFLETKYSPREMILMVQKEVAKRICASPGKMSLLAVSVQYYAQPEFIFEVKRESFWPVPEVDSAVIRLKINSQKNFLQEKKNSKEETKFFFKIVRAGFSSKRKTLANNLATSFSLDKKLVEEKIKKAGFLPKQRAQELTVNDWRKIDFEFRKILSK